MNDKRQNSEAISSPKVLTTTDSKCKLTSQYSSVNEPVSHLTKADLPYAIDQSQPIKSSNRSIEIDQSKTITLLNRSFYIPYKYLVSYSITVTILFVFVVLKHFIF